MWVPGHPPFPAEGTRKALNYWFERFEIHIPKYVKNPEQEHPRIDAAHVPSPEELKRVLIAADARAKAAISVMAFGGQRLQVLGNYDGTDGLVLGDIIDLRIADDGSLAWKQVPAQVLVRKSLSKVGHPYAFFLGAEACEYILKYLLIRKTSKPGPGGRPVAGEKMTADTPIIVPAHPNQAVVRAIYADRERNGGRKLTAEERKAILKDAGLRANWKKVKRFIRTPNVSDLIVKPMREIGMKSNPAYIWRSYFAAHSQQAPVQHDWKEFWVGHKGGISATYSVRKALPEDIIHSMRESYKTVLPFIETTERKIAAIREPLAELFGIQDPHELSPDQLKAELEKAVARKVDAALREQFRERELRSIEKQVAREDALSRGESLADVIKAVEIGLLTKEEGRARAARLRN